MISLTYPWMLLFLPLPLIIYRYLKPYRTKTAAVRVPFFSLLVEASGATPEAGALVLKKNRLQYVIGSLVWLLLVLAVSGPVLIGDPIEKDFSARDVMLAVDISGSMAAKDFKDGSGEEIERLQAVKDVLEEFIAERKDDRVGLIVFGQRAFLQVPFTQDLSAALALLNATEVGMAGPQTALGDAVGLAINTFESSNVTQRMLIVLTDGSDTASRMTPLNASAIAAERGVKMFTIGIGDPNAEGEDRVDFDVLEVMASKAGGEFFTPDDKESLERVYQEIDQAVPRETKTLSYRPESSLHHWPVGTACLLILLGYLLLLLPFGGRRLHHV